MGPNVGVYDRRDAQGKLKVSRATNTRCAGYRKITSCQEVLDPGYPQWFLSMSWQSDVKATAIKPSKSEIGAKVWGVGFKVKATATKPSESEIRAKV